MTDNPYQSPASEPATDEKGDRPSDWLRDRLSLLGAAVVGFVVLASLVAAAEHFRLNRQQVIYIVWLLAGIGALCYIFVRWLMRKLSS